MVRAASSCLISWLQAAAYHAFKGNDLTPDISLLPRGYSELKLRYHGRKTRTRRRATLFHLGRLSWRPLSSIQTTSGCCEGFRMPADDGRSREHRGWGRRPKTSKEGNRGKWHAVVQRALRGFERGRRGA